MSDTALGPGNPSTSGGHLILPHTLTHECTHTLTLNSNTSLPTSPCNNFTNHSSLSLFAIVKQRPAPTKPSTNIATPSLQVRVSRLLWRQLKVRLPRLSAFPSPPGLFFAQGSSSALREPTQNSVLSGNASDLLVSPPAPSSLDYN